MDIWLTPSYRHDKLVNPTLGDLVDVYEDIWVSYVLRPARLLLEKPHGDVAAMSILCTYFEARESARTGRSTNGASRKAFISGFSALFSGGSTDTLVGKAASVVYSHIRCGLAHEGLMNYRVNYTRITKNAFLLTYPRKTDGSLNVEAEVESIVLNVPRVLLAIERDLSGSLEQLRNGSDQAFSRNFRKTVERQWGIGKPDIVIGASAQQFGTEF